MIVFKGSFQNQLEGQIEYIAKDSSSRARNFKSELFKKIKRIPQHPYSYRKSIYFENETIRDLIFKGYTMFLELLSKK